MHFLKEISFLTLLELILRPVLPFLRMTHRLAPVTVVDMIVDLGCGEALLSKEIYTGSKGKDGIFNSSAPMSLSHALIEDTLNILTIDAKTGGILFGTLLSSLIVLCCLNQVVIRF